MTSVRNYVTRKPKDKFKILTFCTHERYETTLCKTGHEFYSLSTSKKWDGEIPDNYHIMDKTNFIPSGYDLILSQSRFGQFEFASRLNQRLRLPIITLEHTVPTPDLSKIHLDKMCSMVGDVNVFISNYSAKVWSDLGIKNSVNVIEHCVDTDVFKPTDEPKDSYILTVANQFKYRDYCLNYSLWESVKRRCVYPMVVVGAGNEDIGFLEAKDTNELVSYYNNAAIYLNTTSHSTIPMSLLEAMSCGCAIITTGTCGIPEFIQDGVNGLVANTEEEVLQCIYNLKDKELRKTLGSNARQTILDRCNENRFIAEWNEIFQKTYEASL